jgi:uncharacterized protein (TIRG00374 family)
MEKLKKALRPNVVIPLILSVALLAALLAFGNIQDMIRAVRTFQPIYILWVVLLFTGYEAVRCFQWLFLLDKLHNKAPRRAQIFAFLVSETTKSIPIGNYFQNYLLAKSEGSDPGRTSAATTFQVLGEVAASLAGIVILGLGAWSLYLRIVIVGGLIVFGFGVWIFTKVHNESDPPQWMQKRKMTRKIIEEAQQFREGAKDLIEPRTLVVVFVNSAIYCSIAGAALYMTAKGMSIANVPFFGVLAVYFFSLACSLIIPLPTDVGAAELTGAGAFLLIGVQKAIAVSVMLIFRLLSILTAIVIAVIGGLILRDEFRAAMQQRGAQGQDKEQGHDKGQGRALDRDAREQRQPQSAEA